MSENTIITKTKENLERVLTSNGSQELEANLLETLTSKLKYDASLFVNQTTGESSDAVIVTLLPISINVLKLSAITPLQRLGTLVELVGALLASKSLSQVLTFISPEDLLTAVKSSQVPPLQRVAIEQISRPQHLKFPIPQNLLLLLLSSWRQRKMKQHNRLNYASKNHYKP